MRRALSLAPAALAAFVSRAPCDRDNATSSSSEAGAPPLLASPSTALPPLAPPPSLSAPPLSPPPPPLPSHEPVPHERLTRLLSIAVMPIRALLGTTVSPGEPFPRDSPHVTLVLPPEGDAFITVRTKLASDAAVAAILNSAYGPAQTAATGGSAWTAPGSGARVSLRSDDAGAVVEWRLPGASAARGFSLADAYAVISVFASAAFGASASAAVALASSNILNSVADLYAQLPAPQEGGAASGTASFGDPSLRRLRPRAPAAFQSKAAAGLPTSPDASADRPNPKTQPLEYLASLGIECKSAGAGVGARASALTWDDLAGASDVRVRVEESILFPLDHPKIYAAVNALTRARTEENKHGVFLISGPPGVGKTTVARIVAAHVERPLVVLTFASIGSAYYAQSESNLQGVLDAVSAIPGAILFVDEADALFPARSAARGGGAPLSSGAAVNSKLLATMLTFLEGVGGAAETSVILATNRPEILDAALLSRCAATLELEPPDAAARAAIWARFAKALTVAERASLAAQTGGFTGRDIKHAAEVAERRHVAALVRGGTTDAGDATPPAFELYAAAARERARSVLGSGSEAGAGAGGGIVFEKWRQQAEAQKKVNADTSGETKEAAGPPANTE